MALTVTSDLTVLTTAESVTNWVAIGAQSPLLEPDFYVQGSNSISRAVSGASVDKGMVWNNTTAIDFTTGTHKDKLVYIWMRSNTPGLMATRAAGGMKVRLGNSTTVFREWYVSGSDVWGANDGWVCFVIDPQSAGSLTTGAYSAASVQYFGGSMITTTTAKGQNFGIDQIAYGRGELRVTGTVAVAGEGIKEIAAADWGTSTVRRGIITEKAGIYYVRGKLVIGHATTATDWSTRNETVAFETTTYYNGTNVVKAIPDASVGGTAGSDGQTSYVGLGFIGGSAATTINMGILVGSDNGRSGSTFTVPLQTDLTTDGRVLATVSASDATMGLSIYASSFIGFEGAIDLRGTGIASDDLFATTFSGCGRLDSNMEIRNCNILNSVALATDGAYIWKSDSDVQKCLFVNNSRAIVFESATGTPFTFSGMSFSANTFDVRNESGSAITINQSTSNASTKEESSGAITLVNSTTLTLTGLKNPTEVRVFNAGTTTAIAGSENVTSGTFTTGIDAASYTSVDIAIISLGYQNIRLLGIPVTSSISIPIQQNIDRQYKNP